MVLGSVSSLPYADSLSRVSGVEQLAASALNKTDSGRDSAGESGDLAAHTPQEEAAIKELATIDAKVKEHEAAHIAAGGSVVQGGASFTYEQGPDQKLYAVAGEVAIDTSEEATPVQSIAKALQIRTAALAPSDPSPQDYQVASTATIMEMQARLQLSKEQSEGSSGLSREAAIRVYQQNA